MNKLFIVLLVTGILLSWSQSNLYLEELAVDIDTTNDQQIEEFSTSINSLAVDIDTTNVESFYGTWKVTEMSWFYGEYFISESAKQEQELKINQPIEDFFITIDPSYYKWTTSEDSDIIDNPQYSLRTYDLNTNSEPGYNAIIGSKDYLESLNIANKPIEYLIVRDPIKDKMDSGEIDWYYVSTPVFIFVDKNTILHTLSDVSQIFKCERVLD